MESRLRFWSIVFSLVLLLAQGCALKRTELTSLEAAVANSVWQEIAKRDEIFGLQGIARIRIQQERERYVHKAAILLQRPSFLRVEAIAPLGLPQLFLSVTEDILTVYLPRQGDFYVGRVSPENLARFLPLPVAASDLIHLLMGYPPPLVTEKEPPIVGFKEGTDYLLVVSPGAGGKHSIKVDQATRRISSLEVYRENGVLLYRVEMDDYRQAGTFPLPRIISFIAGGEETASVTIEYLEVEAVSPQPETAFKIPVPPGIAPKPLP